MSAEPGYARDVLRVLLILLALVVSAPATAMPSCHDAVASAHAMPMDQHRTPDAAPPHACPGCLPAGDWLAPRIAVPVPLPAPAPVGRIAPLDLAGAAPPLLRPPRMG